MKKLIIMSLAMLSFDSAMATVVATQVTCDQLKSLIHQGERFVVGKNGSTVYDLRSACGSSQVFRTANGLCQVFVAGLNPSHPACFPSNESNGG